jgi:murein DD-endopeptidase MepM/ murein hydrolase activator NlpD
MRFRDFFRKPPDPKVLELQKMLKSKGYDLGDFGPNKDGVDGRMGPKTQAALDAYNSGKSPAVSKPDSSPGKPDPAAAEVIPAKGPISGKYGRMVTGPKGNKIPHPGVDIAAPQGAPVIAPGDGTIIFAGNAGTAGNLVELITSDGEKHRFMHLSKILVKKGDKVEKGQQVGAVGNTGFSKGAHLHWEKYASSGQQLDPLA